MTPAQLVGQPRLHCLIEDDDRFAGKRLRGDRRERRLQLIEQRPFVRAFAQRDRLDDDGDHRRAHEKRRRLRMRI